MIEKILFLIILLQVDILHAQKQTLFVVAGQSNAMGKGDSNLSIMPNEHTAFEYRFKTNELIELKDPVGSYELRFQPASTGSAWPAFAKQYNSQTGSKVIIVQAARNGSSCHYKAELENSGTWDRSGRMPLFDSSITKIKAAIKKTGTPLRGIIWIQGERDANAINANELKPAEYKEALVNLISGFRKKLRKIVEIYVVETGNYIDHPQQGFDAVREIQKQVSHELEHVHIVYIEAKNFASMGLMKDQIHYNQIALNDIGAKVARWIITHEKNR